MKARSAIRALLLCAAALGAGPALAQTPAPSPPRPAAAAPSATSPPPATGAVVVSVGRRAHGAAKALARAIYREPTLRPAIDEQTARTLVGEGPACSPADGPAGTPPIGCTGQQAELAALVAALDSACTQRCDGSSVARRLLVSLGQELRAQWVLAVVAPTESQEGAAPASIQPLRVQDERFVPMILSAARSGSGETTWAEVVPMLRSLASPPRAEPQPARTALQQRSPQRSAARKPERDADEGSKVVSSPWFWGGLGVLVATGVTIFAISKSSLGEPDTVLLDGRISP